jgi:hypothetical protein
MIRDPKTYYMEKVYNQNIKIIVDCNEAMVVSNIILFTLDDVLHPWLPYESRNYYY